jgi:hypothetical protein
LINIKEVKGIYALLFLVIFSIAASPFSCCNHSCCGENLKIEYYELHKLGLVVGKRDYKDINRPLIEMSTETLDLTEIGFWIKADSVSKYLSQSNSSNRNFGIITRLNACDPIEPIPVNGVVDIKITSNNSFEYLNSVFTSGTDLKPLFNYKIDLERDLIGYNGTGVLFTFKNDIKRGFSAIFSFEIFFQDQSSLVFDSGIIEK